MIHILYNMAIRVALGLVALVVAAAQAETPGEHFDRLVREGIMGPVTDWSEKDGHFVLAVASVKWDGEQSADQLLKSAACIAQRHLAGFLGEQITVDEEIKKVSIKNKTIDKMGVVKIEVVSNIKEARSLIRAQISQSMAGSSVFDSRSRDGRLYVSCILSEKQLKAVGLLGMRPGGAVEIARPGQEPPDEVSGVVALGLAMVAGSDEASARAKAIENAQRSAVEQAFGVCVKTTSQLRNLDPATLKDKQFTASFGALKGFEILNEEREGAVYKIKIRAVVVRKVKLDLIVKAWQSDGASFYLNPGLDRDNPGADLLDVFKEFFSGLGFKITNKAEAADYEILLNSKHLDKVHPITGRDLTQLQLTVRIKDVRLGTIMLTEMNDPKAAVNDLADKARRLQICAQKACKQLEHPLRAKVGDLVMDMIQNGRDIAVVFQGVGNADGGGYAFIENQLQWMPGIRGGFNKTVHASKREIVYKTKYSGSLDAIQSALTEALAARYDDGRPKLTELSSNQLVYKLEGERE